MDNISRVYNGWPFAGPQRGGGRGLTPAHGDPDTGDPARVPETGAIIPHAPDLRSAGRGRKRGSDGREASRRPSLIH